MTRNYKQNRESWGAIRPSGSKVIRYQASYIGTDGERYKAPYTFATRSDAREWLTGMKRVVDSGKWKNPRTIDGERFGQYAEVWIAQRKKADGSPLAPNTVAEYRRYLEKGLSSFVDAPIATITPAMVRSWHAVRSEETKTAAANEARFLRGVFNTALEDEIIDRNPVPSNLTRGATGRFFRIPTEDELKIILKVMGERAPRLRFAILLAACSGLRLSEWRALRRRDLIRKGDRYEVQVKLQAVRNKANWKEWIVGITKNPEGVRVVSLPVALTPEAEMHLEKHVESTPDALIFTPVGNAEYLDDLAFNRHWNKAREAAGLKKNIAKAGDPPKWEYQVREHDLRALAATNFSQTGAALQEIMEFLGHSTHHASLAYMRKTDRQSSLVDQMPFLSKIGLESPISHGANDPTSGTQED